MAEVLWFVVAVIGLAWVAQVPLCAFLIGAAVAGRWFETHAVIDVDTRDALVLGEADLGITDDQIAAWLS